MNLLFTLLDMGVVCLLPTTVAILALVSAAFQGSTGYLSTALFGLILYHVFFSVHWKN